MRIRKTLVNKALKNWTSVNELAGKLNEEELQLCLRIETGPDGMRRWKIIERLHQTYCHKRQIRERKDLKTRAKKYNRVRRQIHATV